MQYTGILNTKKDEFVNDPSSTMRISKANREALKNLDPSNTKSLNDILAEQIIAKAQRESDEYKALNSAGKWLYDYLSEHGMTHEASLEYSEHVKTDKTILFLLGKLAKLEIQGNTNGKK